MKSTIVTAGITTALLGASALAQVSTIPHSVQAYSLDSGYLNNPAATTEVIYRGTVVVPGEDWLQVRFRDTNLPSGSRLRLTSGQDGAVQWFDASSLRDYANASAYFNGNRVVVELLAAPGTTANRVNVVEVMAGSAFPIGPKTICGPTDDRTPSNDRRQGRQWPTGCTSWLINATTILTAGHCTGSSPQQIHFQVPFSTNSGGLVLPPPRHQYAYDMNTLRRLNGGTGSDWAVAATVRNSNTGLYAGQAQGQWYSLGTVPSSTAGQTIRITGYGTTSSGVPRSWNQVQKTHTGGLAAINPTLLRYTADTSGGNSGSPVIHENTGRAVGIHTHGGCSSSGGSNLGTRIDRSDLQSAIRAVRFIKKAGLVVPIGTGCAGTAGTPTLGSEGFPDQGKTILINAAGLAANQTGVLFIGASNENWNGNVLPMDLSSYGMAGCSLLVSPDVSLPAISSAFGSASTPFAVPRVSALIGLAVFGQYAGFDPGANPLGVTWTNGIIILIGD